MEAWFIIIVSLCISVLLRSIFKCIISGNNNTKIKLPLPPGPPTVMFIGNLIWLRKSIFQIESILRDLKTRYGPLITLSVGSRPIIFVASHNLAHNALIHNGAVFANRTAPSLISTALNRNRKSINSSAYGPTWRLLRRNLTYEILHPSRVKLYSESRRWVLQILVHRLLDDTSSSVIDHIQYAMFCLLVLMCFGDKLHESQIKEIEAVQRGLLFGLRGSFALNIWPRLGKVLFRKKWKELIQLYQDQNRVLIPLIRARVKAKKDQNIINKDDEVVAYVDTLVDLQLPEENNRKLDEGEMVSLCNEFLNAGTDTTSTALQWIMANLVKYPHIQDKLYKEINGVVGPPPSIMMEQRVVEEEDLHKMPYLKAVVLEGLRRHPPVHFVLPHTVTRDVELDGYMIPRNAIVNFMVADMGWDPKVWENPMEFKPERFLQTDAFDITGSREIKMMPFGAGRRMCPASGLAILHLEYFVANLIWYFEWTPIEGHEVDLSEKQEITTVMKNPLRARIAPRM